MASDRPHPRIVVDLRKKRKLLDVTLSATHYLISRRKCAISRARSTREPIDCYRTIISTEGPLGLYKGFGALILQFAVHFMVLRATKWILTELGTMLMPKPKPIKPQKSSYYDEI